MGRLWKLAFRNVFRFKRRTLITLFTVSLALALLIVSMSLINGLDKQSMNNIIDSQTAHIKIFKQGYYQQRKDLPLGITLEDTPAARELVKQIPGVKELEGRILFRAGLIKGMDELPCMGVAVEPQYDPQVFNIRNSLVEGEGLAPEDNKALVGINLAREIGLAVGDSITLRLITSSGDEAFTWNAIDLEIKGIFDTGNPDSDSQWVMVPKKLAQEGLGLQNQVTEIAVRLDDHAGSDRNIARMKERLEETLNSAGIGENLEVYTWKELGGTYIALSKFKKKRVAGIIMIMLFIAAMGIINTMLMSVWERTREIGLFGSLGMRKSEIKWLFLLEGGFIGGIGSLLGCILGGLGGWYLEKVGINIINVGESAKKIISSTFPVKDAFYGDITVETLVLAFILGVGVSLAASLYPAAKAAKLKPIEALRYS